MSELPTDRLVKRPLVPRQKATPESRKALISGATGSVLEWFDFALYGAMAATVFPVIFFSGQSQSMAALMSFATFGVGIFARPLGGVVFGYLGDKIGRRTVLIVTFIAMGLSSTAIGLLPGYAAIGFAAPVILVLLRFAQGFALGGEATGAQLMTMEHAAKDRRGFYTAVMAMGSPASQVLANLLLTVLAGVLSTEAFYSWGWRLPFLLSVLLVLVGIYIRLKVEETPVFKAGQKDAPKESVGPHIVVKNYWRIMLKLMTAYAPIIVTFYVVSVFGISYMTNGGMTEGQAFSVIMVANLFAVFAILLGGRLADVYGRIKILLIGGIGCLLGAFVYFPVVDSNNFPLILVTTSLIMVFAQFGNGGHGALFAEAFRTEHRYTGAALTLTGANLLFAAPLPFIASWMTYTLTDGNTMPITILWIVVIVGAIVVMLRMKEGPTLEGEKQEFGRYVTPEMAEQFTEGPADTTPNVEETESPAAIHSVNHS